MTRAPYDGLHVHARVRTIREVISFGRYLNPAQLTLRFSAPCHGFIRAIMGVSTRDYPRCARALLFSWLYKKEDKIMNENEQAATETLTTNESEIMDETGASAEESHEIGEFDFMREQMNRIESMLTDVLARVTELQANAAAIAVDNGAYVADVDGDADVIDGDAIAVIPDYEDLDLDL